MIKLLEHGYEPHATRGRTWREWLLWPSDAAAAAPPADRPKAPLRAGRP
jgi:hypothetical protein